MKCSALLLSILLLTGCKALPNGIPPAKPLTCCTQDGMITFTLGAEWTQDADDHSYDLCAHAQEGTLAMGVFSYNRLEDEAAEPLDVLTFHVEDIQAKRENIQLLEENRVREDSAHRYTTTLLEGTQAGVVNCYYFTLIEFSGFSNQFAILLQTAPPDQFDACRAAFDTVAASATLITTPLSQKISPA